MRAIVLSLILIGAVVLAASPSVSATDYEECDPEGIVCIVQDDGSGEDQACEDSNYLNNYGKNEAQNGVYLDSPTGDDDQLFVKLNEFCGHWHYQDSYRYGLVAGGELQGNDIDVRWQSYDSDPNNNCFWGNDHKDGNRALLIVESGGETVGVAWWDRTTEDCNTGETSEECHTEIHLGPAASEDAGCPAGGPPAPPSPDEVPYGQLIP